MSSANLCLIANTEYSLAELTLKKCKVDYNFRRRGRKGEGKHVFLAIFNFRPTQIPDKFLPGLRRVISVSQPAEFE